MNNDRWFGFVWGVALGLLIGVALAGGYCWPEITKARAEAENARDDANRSRDAALHADEIMHQARDQAIEERDRAVKELEALKKANKDR
jgi:F0F1-type ATP synthase membrane subunit b/b'